MSDLSYPALVLNRKFAGSGRPYWLAEMRFSALDTEAKDVMEQSSEAAVEVCRKTWEFDSCVPAEHFGTEYLSRAGGQIIYHVTLPGYTLDPKEA